MEVHAKVADYLTAGTRLVWVADPRSRAVSTYRTVLAPHRLIGFRVSIAQSFAWS